MNQDEPRGEEPRPAVAFGSTVTILFSDIRGFTEFTDEYGDEAAYRMLQHHDSLVEEQIALYGGHVVKKLGDSYMVSFDAARTAVTCAISMQHAIEQYNRTRQGPKIEIGVGINTGEPVRDAGDLFGGAVNLASRICGAAGAGRVLVSETLRHVVGRMEGCDYIDRGFFEIKGFREPQHLFEVDWSGVGAVRAPSVGAPPPVSQAAARPPEPTPAPPRRPTWTGPGGVAALLVAGLALLGAGILAGRGALTPSAPLSQPTAPAPDSTQPAATAPGGPSSPVATAEPGAAAAPTVSPWKLLRSGDFSDLVRGLIQDKRVGSGQTTLSNGRQHQYHWEYGYREGAFVVVLKGPYPDDVSDAFLGSSAEAADKVLGDFAAEVRARVTRSPQQAQYQIQYSLGPGDFFNFSITRGSYGVWWNRGSQTLANGRSAILKPGGEENHLRLEVIGDVMTLFANGQQLDRVRHPELAVRPGAISLGLTMTGPPADGEVEVRFTDFKLYGL